MKISVNYTKCIDVEIDPQEALLALKRIVLPEGCHVSGTEILRNERGIDVRVGKMTAHEYAFLVSVESAEKYLAEIGKVGKL